MSERDIFLAILDLSDADARAAYLDRACGDDASLRARVESLIDSHEEAGSFLDLPSLAQGEGPTEVHDNSGDEDSADALSFLVASERSDSLGRLGHYEVLEVLGKGGFGIVFRAFDEVLQRVVAVKVLSPQMAATSPARKRFLREARASAAVRHENVVQVHEIGEQPLPFLVMEFVPGETLQQRLDRTGPLEMGEVLRLGRQLAEGLAAAHERGLIHRDIKPSNILIETGPQRTVKITDFGLARAADDASLTRSGVVAGTPMYMAPEQARGETLDQRADLFSLGSVLYTMLTGRPPFRATGTMGVLKRVCEDTPRPIREVIPEAPQWLCRIVEKLHAKTPAERYQSARDVADVLADCEAQVATHGVLRDESRIPAGKRTTGRQRWWFGVAALLLVPLLAWGVWLLTRPQPRNPFGLPDVRDPAGADVQQLAERTRLTGGLDDPNAERWVERAVVGSADSLDGEWFCRWKEPRSTSWGYTTSPAQVKTIGDRVFFLYADTGGRILLETRRVGNRLVGREWKIDRNEFFPCVFEIVSPERLDGTYGGGSRFDFQRRLIGSKEQLRSPKIPRQAADVLPFLAGNWKVEMQTLAPKQPSDSGATFGQMTCDSVAAGKVTRASTTASGGVEPRFLYSFDAEGNLLRQWQAWSNGNAHGPFIGLFNPDNRALLWRYKISADLESFHLWTFEDANTIKTRLFHQDANNRIVWEMRITFTRDRGIPARFPDSTVDPKRDDETKLLDRLVGQWVNEVTVAYAARPDQSKRQSASVTAKSILAGRFLEAVISNDKEGTSDYSLAWFDPAVKQYRQWFFSGAGHVTSLTGTWDEKTNTMTWKSPTDASIRGRLRMEGNDLRELVIRIEDGKGNVLTESTTIQRRVNPTPFVRLTGKGKERTFATLADAVKDAPAGAIVEVRGNGPFPINGVTIERPLTIRAGEGFAPVLEHDPRDGLSRALLNASAALRLEGLTLHNALGERRRLLVNTAGHSLVASNCRFVSADGLCRAAGASRVEVSNCEFSSAWSMASAIDWTNPPSKSSLAMRNCVSPNWPLFLNTSANKIEAVEIEFTDNTFVSAYLLSCYSNGDLLGDGKQPRSFRLRSANNLLQCRALFRVEIYLAKLRIEDWPVERVERLAQAIFDWKGEGNVVSPTAGYELWHGDGKGGVKPTVRKREEWKQVWGAGDVGGAETAVSLLTSVLPKWRTTPAQLTPGDYRLGKDSPVVGLGKDGKNPGANIDHVGPGSAYERWKKTKEYTEWQTRTDEAMRAK